MSSSRSFEELVEEIRRHYDIVDVVASYVNLKKVGRNFVGLCPFHSEKTPSFTVSPEKQIFKCFGCGVGGDVITFYMKIKGIEWKEALIELAEKIGIEVDFKTIKKVKKDKSLIEINYKILKFYHHLLLTHKDAEKAKEYLKNRGLSEETIKKFSLGFAPPEGRVISSYLRTLVDDLEKIEKLGIVKKTSEETYIDFFRDRIIFPIFNLKGECVGFGGRALSPEVEPKYLNTPDSPIYKKSEILYGLFHTKDFIKQEKSGYLVEGYFDLLSLWEKGIKNVVATCGTALTEKHVEILKTFCDNWIIFYDGDIAGKKAGVRAISLFLKKDILPKCIELPLEDDPDSFVQKFNSLEELQEELKKREKGCVEFVVNYYKLVEEDLIKVYKESINVFKIVEDPFLRQLIAKDLSKIFDLPEDEIKKALISSKTTKTSLKIEPLEEPFPEKEPDLKVDEDLKIIAQFIYNYPEYLEKLEKIGLLDLLKIKNTCYSNFVQNLMEKIKAEKKDFICFSDPQFQSYFSDILFLPPFDNPEEVFIQIQNYIKNQLKKLKIKKLLEELQVFEKLGKKEEIERYLYLIKNSLCTK